MSNYSWHYAKLKYQFNEGIGIHGSLGVDIDARIDDGKLWTYIVVSSSSGQFGRLDAYGYVQLVVDDKLIGERKLSTTTQQERRDPGPTISQASPFASQSGPPQPTRVYFIPGAIDNVPDLYEVKATEVTPIPPHEPNQSSMPPPQWIGNKKLSTSSEGPNWTEMKVETRKRLRILRVQINIQVTTGDSTTPSIPPSISPEEFPLD